MPAALSDLSNPELLAEIEAIKMKGLETPDLYREVIHLLFFQRGITPTANRLYGLVRKGTMSAPSAALEAFYADLRDKTRLRITGA